MSEVNSKILKYIVIAIVLVVLTLVVVIDKKLKERKVNEPSG